MLPLVAAVAAGALLAGAGLLLAQPAANCVTDLSIATDHDAGEVTLNWTAVAGATSYTVERALDGGPFEAVGNVPAPATGFFDVPPEGIVSYRVAADGPPDDTCPVAETHLGGQGPDPDVPLCVGGLTAQAHPDGSITVGWASITGAVSYDILRGPAGGPVAPYAIVGDPAFVSFTDTGTTPGQAYAYEVHANGIVAPGTRCERVEATAVPFLGPGWAAGLVLAGGAALMAAARRRS